LGSLVTDRRYLLREELREFFPGPWPLMRQKFSAARRAVQRLNGVYIEGYGFSLNEAQWKLRLLQKEAEDGNVKGFLKRANVVLGSLAKVIPVLEPVKEYKEMAEASVS